MIKRFKTISDKYRKRGKSFGLKFNLIAAIFIATICNMELA